MKYITLVIFILCLNISASAVNYLQLQESYSITPHKEFINEVNNTARTESYVQDAPVSEPSIFESIIDVIKALWYFIKVFGWGIISLPYLLQQFGLETGLSYIISGPIYLIYVLGLAQWIGNKQSGGMQ